MIDRATVQRIKDTARIVEVVSDYVHLTRRGANYMGLCPFHNERTPSFSVNPARNICHCFSCGKGGSPVNFIMEKENISYHDALKQLARKYGIKVEERELTPEERRVATEREGLLVAAEAAMKIMESDLTDTQEGRDVGLAYLYQRGVTEEARKAFRLGYALDSGSHMTSSMLRQGFDLETLKKLGLTGVSQQGHNYDKYRGRVIFPIINSSGRTVGFGGRDLKGGPAKYINSPESVLYRKNNELYGIFQAKNEIARQNNCFLVEGYLDVISMWQSGLKNVVASSGTSLTDGQIAAIHRFTPNITLVYDGDAAGIKAALRGIDMLLSHKMKVSVLLLPDGHDPDSFSKVHTPEEFRDYVSRNSVDIIRFKINVLMKDMGDDPRRKGEVVISVVESIACIPEYVDRMIYVGECSRMLQIDEQAVSAAVEKARREKVEQMRNDRRRRELYDRYPANDSGPSAPASPSAGNTTDATASAPSSPDTPVTHSADSPAIPSSATGNGQSPAPPSEPASQGIAGAIEKSEALRRNPLLPVEKRMIELIVKYGYLNMPPDTSPASAEAEDDDRTASPHSTSPEETFGDFGNPDDYYPILDFIADELQDDEVEFTVPQFKRVFDILLDSFEDYLLLFNKERESIEAELEERRRAGHQQIATSGGSLSDLERAEIKLENELRDDYNSRLKEFARIYPGNFLANHEEDEVRKIANEVICERYVLSKIYAAPTMNSDRFSEVDEVVRAITEWKSEILDQMLHGLMAELRDLSASLDGERGLPADPDSGEPLEISVIIRRIQEIQQKMTSIINMRSEIARNIGERVLAPRKIR